MLGKEAQPRGLSFLVLIALTALAAVRGISALTLALAVLPIAVAVLAYTDGWMAVAALCASAGVACIWRFPAPMLVGLLPWCALCGVIALVPLKNRFARPMLWAGLCVAGWAAMLGTMLSVFGAPLNEGVARAMCDLINESPQRNTILLNAYNAGLSRLDLSGPLSSLTFVLMPDATRLQLLYSLRVTLEEMLPSAMCNGIVVHTGAINALKRYKGAAGLAPPPARRKGRLPADGGVVHSPGPGPGATGAVRGLALCDAVHGRGGGLHGAAVRGRIPRGVYAAGNLSAALDGEEDGHPQRGAQSLGGGAVHACAYCTDYNGSD